MKMTLPKQGTISVQALRRLPGYYNYLKAQSEAGVQTISAPAIAKVMGLNEVQVRKDLAAVSTTPGKPRTGFMVQQLLQSIGVFLGYNNKDEAVLVGAGQLGRALLSYKAFEENGVHIVAAFDDDPAVAGQSFGGKKVFGMQKMPSLCKRLGTRIGIITVPAQSAQQVCNTLVQNGVLAIWNFAPVHLTVPEGVLVQNENMAASLAMLSQHLAEREICKEEVQGA